MQGHLMRGAAFVGLAAFVLVQAHARDIEDQRAQFADAMTALSSGDVTTYRSIATGLENYPLHPYLRYAALTRNLARTSPVEAQQFLDANNADPIGVRFRKRWLRHLASSARWREFLTSYRPDLGTDLDCRHLEAQYHTGQRKAALEGVPAIWISAKSRPDACDPVFRLWIDAGGPSRGQAWKRLQLAAQAGQLRLAEYLKRFLPAVERSTADLWIQAYRSPKTVLRGKALDPNLTQATPIAVSAMRRLARVSPETAAELLAPAAGRFAFPVDSIAALRYRIAISLAVDGHPAAAFWMDSVPVPVRDEALRAWSVRTHLRNRDWGRVLNEIESMPDGEARAVRWRYWRARAQEALGETEPALAEYRSLAALRDYHSFLSADRVGLKPNVNDRPVAVDTALQGRLMERPAMQRARELFALERVSAADAEWRFALKGADADTFRAAAKIAQEWGWYYQGIATIARARDWDDLELRFPTRYRELVLAAAQRDGIDPAWIFGVMRQESMFNPTIRSHAGAVGLMQIMPATGRRVAKDLGMSWSGSRTLVRPEDNIEIGSRYLRMGLDRLDGRHIFATAGYNAGPSRVERWRKTEEMMPADIWIELVPFRETRRYLRKVIEYTVIYQHQLGRRTDFVSRVMLPVGGRSETATASGTMSLFPG